MSRNIRSLCNTTHSNKRYVPITGYRRHNCTRTKYINSHGHHSSIVLSIDCFKNAIIFRLEVQLEKAALNLVSREIRKEIFRSIMFGTLKYLLYKPQSQNNWKHILTFRETTSYIVKINEWRKTQSTSI